MKRWTSVSFALGSLFGTVIVLLFAFTQLKTTTNGAAASPVGFSQNSVQTTGSTSMSGFSDAKSYFVGRGVNLSLYPASHIADVSWDTYDSVTDQNVMQSANELQVEWQKYGDSAIKTSGLKNIYLIKNLRVHGQFRSGMPEPRLGDALYFDISDIYLKSEGGKYLRRTFHHEFSHLIEYNLYGSYAPSDTIWSNCNASGFAYGNGGSSMYADPSFAHKAHPTYAFIDGYATSAPEEDKAEMFAWYMSDPSSLQKLADDDTGIACKLNLTESLLRKL